MLAYPCYDEKTDGKNISFFFSLQRSVFLPALQTVECFSAEVLSLEINFKRFYCVLNHAISSL